MRFMMLMIPKGYEKATPGNFPADVQQAAAGFPEMQAQSGQRKGS